MAEGVGFEPTIRFCRIHTFQACAFDRSATPPGNAGTLAKCARHASARNYLKSDPLSKILGLVRCWRTAAGWSGGAATAEAEGTRGMMRRVLRLLGVLLLVVGLALLARDLVDFARGGGLQLEALGSLWTALSPGSLGLLQDTIERYASDALWNGVEVWLLLQPACGVGILLGLLLLLATPRRRRPHGFR
jgi:hypothetical protein